MYASMTGHSSGRDNYDKKPRSASRQSKSLYRQLANLVSRLITGRTLMAESELYLLEEPARHRVPDVSTLVRATAFSPHQVKRIYRGFKADCPHGVICEEEFKDIFARFFPQHCNSSLYARYVFNTFDMDPNDRVIKFEDFLQWLSRLCLGSREDRLRWTFRLYDLNGDGAITRDELAAVAASVWALVEPSSSGSSAAPPPPPPSQQQQQQRQHDPALDDTVDQLFQQMDSNRDGLVSWDEFSAFCCASTNWHRSIASLTGLNKTL